MVFSFLWVMQDLYHQPYHVMTPFSNVYGVTLKTLIRFLDPQVVEFINAKSESPNLWVPAPNSA